MRNLLWVGLLFIPFEMIHATSISSGPPLSHAWSGAYFGATVGGVGTSADARIATVAEGYLSPVDAALVNQVGSQTIRSKGFTAGIDAGYNWVWQRYFIGIEADVASLKAGGSSHSHSVSYITQPANDFMIGSYANSNWLATLRPRIGVVMQNTLFYLTGGAALTRLNGNFYFTDSAGKYTSGSIETTKAGYDIGCGAEMALTQRWSVKAEYLYTYFNRTSATTTGSNLTSDYPNQRFQYSTNFNMSILRLGFNYKFA